MTITDKMINKLIEATLKAVKEFNIDLARWGADDEDVAQDFGEIIAFKTTWRILGYNMYWLTNKDYRITRVYLGRRCEDKDVYDFLPYDYSERIKNYIFLPF